MWCCPSYVVVLSSVLRPAHAGEGGERTGCHHCCVFKLSPSCFSAYQRCKLGNRPSARKGLYTNCKVRTSHFQRHLALLTTLIGFLFLLFCSHYYASRCCCLPLLFVWMQSKVGLFWLRDWCSHGKS